MISLHVATPEFVAFPKLYRLLRPVVITEKIDGTNAAVGVTEDVPHGVGADEVYGPGIVINRATMTGPDDGWDPVYVYAQSRKRIISPESDNFGFARWVREHASELASGLGPGLHFGEWWGRGIQRGYDLEEKRFSLFNVARWPNEVRPACCDVVPTLLELDELNTIDVKMALKTLEQSGSVASPGFSEPEGIVVFHQQANQAFKVTIKDDHKGAAHGS